MEMIREESKPLGVNISQYLFANQAEGIAGFNLLVCIGRFWCCYSFFFFPFFWCCYSWCRNRNVLRCCYSARMSRRICELHKVSELLCFAAVGDSWTEWEFWELLDCKNGEWRKLLTIDWNSKGRELKEWD